MLELSFVVAPFAYVGPGAGLSMLGALLAVVGLVLLAMLAPLFYVVRIIRVMFFRQKETLQVAPTHLKPKP